MLRDLQTQCVTEINSKTYFSADPAIVAVSQDLKDIANEITRRLQRIGVGIVLMATKMTTSTPAPYPAWDGINLVARVIENVIVNRGASGSGQPADLIAEAVAYYLHKFSPTATGNPLRVTGINLVEDPDVLIYDVSFLTGGVTSAEPTRIT